MAGRVQLAVTRDVLVLEFKQFRAAGWIDIEIPQPPLAIKADGIVRREDLFVAGQGGHCRGPYQLALKILRQREGAATLTAFSPLVASEYA